MCLASNQYHTPYSTHINIQPDPDVLGASALSHAPVQSHASIGQVDATMDTSPGGGIVPAVPG